MKGPVRIPLPKITLSGDSVYFFDVPPRLKHHEEEEESNPHKQPRWNTAGKFTLDVSDDVEEVTVKASLGVADNGLFAKVCTFEREDGAKGLGVVVSHLPSARSPKQAGTKQSDDVVTQVPDEAPQADRLNYVKFAVQIPSKAKFKHFETVLWNWTHAVADIGDSASFRTFSLAGVNGNIHVEVSLHHPRRFGSSPVVTERLGAHCKCHNHQRQYHRDLGCPRQAYLGHC